MLLSILSMKWIRGVARNLLGDKRGVPVPGEGLGAKSQKPETHAEYSTEHSHRSSKVAYTVQSLIILWKNFQLRRRGAYTHAPPWLRHWNKSSISYDECDRVPFHPLSFPFLTSLGSLGPSLIYSAPLWACPASNAFWCMHSQVKKHFTVSR